jgi:hypothetical protein
MRMAPLVVLCLIPAGIVALSGWVTLNFTLETSLLVLMLANGIGSGGDGLAMMVVLRQVPVSAQLCFRGGKAS